MTGATNSASTARGFEVERYRADFPILAQEVHGKPLVFLDSAASAQKPRQVLDTVREVYETEYANIHRGAYYLSERATVRFEAARKKVQKFLNAARPQEIVFTKNATESINLVAHSYGRGMLRPGDEVLISDLEHHSNIIPWQLLRDSHGIVLRSVPIGEGGEFALARYREMLSEKTKLVAITHTSNALGTITPAAEIVRLAHDAGAKVLLDGSQAAVHMPVDVQTLDCDFYVFTGHKLYGPSGVGVLYGKEALLDAMPPFLGGGEMIAIVTLEKSTWAALPHKFEAGTPPIAQVIGLGAAVDYVTAIGMDRIAAHEGDLLRYATQRLSAIEGLTIYGTAAHKAAVISFALDGVHPHDVATIIDRNGVSCRAGHHCAQLVMQHYGIAGTTRASFGLYNTRADADCLAGSLQTALEIFR